MRCGGEAPGVEPQANLVERSRRKMGWQRRAGFQTRFAPQGTLGPVHHESGGRWPLVRTDRRACRRTFSGTLRADRESDEKYSTSQPSKQPAGEEVQVAVRQVWFARGIQHRLHHLPAHRAVSLLDEK